MANRCISPINALPSKMRYGAVRARAIRYGGFAIETELPCINGLSAWFTIAHVDAIDDHELLMTEGAIGNAKDIAEAIVAALAKPASSPANADLIKRLNALVEKPGRDWRTGDEFIHCVHSQDIVDIIREAAEALSQSTSAGRGAGDAS